ncbi:MULTISPECIES: IS3 family transposase [unclassified Gilliamella]|uniref:IS3 family transposase n=1 Tax=unclassified Gilliamella TaxID=2685620 RepID=UPI00080EA512|nr:IS3 family transposase [Gilliamella apicola]OCG19311.1 hypothetical protein A9G23_09235 [Gilliamella apicola]OCG22394.1 hypothetical protein A9G22_07440 [Gilliamella apicola]
MTIDSSRRAKRSFTNEFKKQMVMLYQNGKKRADIVAEYDLTKSALDKWITQYQTTGSFIAKIFNNNYRAYGTRRLQAELRKQGITVSRHRIGRIMAKNGWVSKYTCKKYCIQTEKSHESPVGNELNREFDIGQPQKILVTDLTYVRVKQRWHYLCVIVDISNREIVGRRAGRHKPAALVMQAMSQIPMNLQTIELFHSDRGKEFDNHLIDECLTAFGITRSLSRKGCPYDNAIAESTFKAVKTEFVSNTIFDSMAQLKLEFNHYVDWFNYNRLHSTLNDHSPIEYQRNR